MSVYYKVIRMLHGLWRRRMMMMMMGPELLRVKPADRVVNVAGYSSPVFTGGAVTAAMTTFGSSW